LISQFIVMKRLQQLDTFEHFDKRSKSLSSFWTAILNMLAIVTGLVCGFVSEYVCFYT